MEIMQAHAWKGREGDKRDGELQRRSATENTPKPGRANRGPPPISPDQPRLPRFPPRPGLDLNFAFILTSIPTLTCALA